MDVPLMNSTCRYTALSLLSIYLIIHFCSISGSGHIDGSVSGMTFDVGISLGKSTNVNITKVQNFDIIEEIWQLIMKSE
jgi:hypothetical protein